MIHGSLYAIGIGLLVGVGYLFLRVVMAVIHKLEK
jgi:hypothetical protein